MTLGLRRPPSHALAHFAGNAYIPVGLPSAWGRPPGRPLSLPVKNLDAQPMSTDLRSDLDTYRNRLDELGRFL